MGVEWRSLSKPRQGGAMQRQWQRTARYPAFPQVLESVQIGQRRGVAQFFRYPPPRGALHCNNTWSSEQNANRCEARRKRQFAVALLRAAGTLRTELPQLPIWMSKSGTEKGWADYPNNVPYLTF